MGLVLLTGSEYWMFQVALEYLRLSLSYPEKIPVLVSKLYSSNASNGALV